MEEECHRNMAFSLFHADELPLVKIQSVESKPLPGGITQVTVIIENPKTCPTHSTADVRRKLTPPDIVSLHSVDKGLKVILGLTASEPFFREPTEQKREPAQMKLDAIPAHGIVYVRWLVSGKGPFEVRVESVKGGRDLRKGE